MLTRAAVIIAAYTLRPPYVAAMLDAVMLRRY